MRQAVVAEALHSLRRFALDSLKEGLADSAIQVLTGDFNMVQKDVEAMLPPFQVGNSWQEKWQVVPSAFGLSGDLLLVKGTHAKEWDVPIGKSYATKGVRIDDHDAFGMWFQMPLPFQQEPARTATVGAAQPAATMQNCNESFPIVGDYTQLSVSAVGAAQLAAQQRMTKDAEISEMPNGGRDSKSPPQSLPRKSEADAVAQHAEGGHFVMPFDNAPGAESTGEGSVAAAGDSPHMPAPLALTEPAKSDAGAVAEHAPGQRFATPLESGSRSEDTAVTLAGAGDAMSLPQFQPRTNEDTAVAQHTGGVAGFALGLPSGETRAAAEERIALQLGLAESALEDSPRKLDLVSPPGMAATHSLSDFESSDEADGAATGEAAADPAAHAFEMMRQLHAWFNKRFGGAADDAAPRMMHHLHALLFEKTKLQVDRDYWFDPNVPDTKNVVVSQTYMLERVRSVLEKREKWLKESRLPLNHRMDGGQRAAFTKAMKNEYDEEPHPQYLYQRDRNWWEWKWSPRRGWYWDKKFTPKQIHNRRHSRWHRETQRRAGCKQFWEVISYTGSLDIDTLRTVRQQSIAAGAGQPEPDEAEEAALRAERQTARLTAAKARSCFCRARRLAESIQAGVKSAASLSPHELELLARLEDDSLRKEANKLTMQVGHGTIWAKDGTQSMLGQNTRSHTRRVLDHFEPFDPEELDLALYT